MEYACTAWIDPYQQNNIHKLEMVQRRAARYVKNRYNNTSSVTDLLHQLEWDTLENRRKIARLTLMYKITNGIVNIDPSSKLIPPNRYSRKMHNHTFQHPSCNTTMRSQSYYPRTIREWNALPADTVKAASLDSFKARIN